MADAKMLKKVPVREQDPKVRATNFEEVCLGYNQEEAMEEAQRCLGCKKPKCVEGCPVSINIPGFIEEIKEGKIEEAYKVIGLSSALPAICGRVCPQESQCEGKCIRGVKGEAVSIGKLERFVADYALEHDIKPVGAEVKNGHKVAVIGSGPSGLTCAGDLAKAGYDVTVFEALHELGGVLVYGIPEFRLPKQKVVKKEIEKVKELGVKFETNVVIGKSTTIDQLIEDEGFEAVFLSLIHILNLSGNSGMATAGSGDVLAGLLAGILCMYLKTEEQPSMVLKAALGVYLHGLCGDLAAAEKGKRSMLAGDIIAYLPRALAICEEESKS